MLQTENNEKSEQLTFTFAGVREGFQQSIPVAIGAFIFGTVLGVLARQVGLSLVEITLMSMLVFAGASQFTALGIWFMPLPIPTIILTVFIVNLRHALMSASLYPWFSKLKTGQLYSSLYFLTDESWALQIQNLRQGKGNGAFLLGSGLALFLAWVSATIFGRLVGNLLPDPSKIGLNFAFTAVFIALIIGMWEGKKSIRPWLAAGVVAILTNLWLGGQWYILLGGIAGALVGALEYREKSAELALDTEQKAGEV